MGKKLYWYKMKRPVGPGCQPKGFVKVDYDVGYYGAIAYDRLLTEEEIYEYELTEYVREDE